MNASSLFLFVPLSILALGATACTADAGADEALDSSESALYCRDLSATYKVISGCTIDGKIVAKGADVALTQTGPGCADVTLSASVTFHTPGPTADGRPFDPYRPYYCGMAKYNCEVYGEGCDAIAAACDPSIDTSPGGTTTTKDVTQTFARSTVRDWSYRRVQVGSCQLSR
ncbi:MAG: hypothetical protein KC657_13645 [Myxococcales bacterium]|nr:hypothetical protein [Myxococcales bacterium]